MDAPSSLLTLPPYLLEDDAQRGYVLEHLDDPASLLRCSRTLLKPGGVVLASIPNGWGPFELESRVYRTRGIGHALYKPVDLFTATLNKFVLRGHWIDPTPPGIPYNADSGHVQFFTMSAFRRMVDASGFNIATTRKLSFWGGPYTNTLWARTRWLCALNNALAEVLPAFAVTAWAFELRPAHE